MSGQLSKNFVCLVALAVGLSACGVIQDRSERYLEAREGEPLKLADGQSDEGFRAAYPVPPIKIESTGQDRNHPRIPPPPDMTSEITDENYVVEEVGDTAWVLVNDVPGRVWPSVASYLSGRGLGVAFESTQLGLFQTDVVNFSLQARSLLELAEAEDGESLKLVQARVAPGVRRKTTEVQLRIRKIDASPGQILPWQGTPGEPVLEKRLLADLAEYLKSREDSKSYSRAALEMDRAPKVTLVKDDERTRAIALNVSFARAWAEVQRALTEAEVPVVDLDRSEGRLYVDFRSEDERKPGWFSWFSDPPRPQYTFHVQLQEQNGLVEVTTGKADDYAGEDRSALLLSRLYEFLY